MSTSESRFADRLATITGANVSKIAALRGVAPAAHAEPDAPSEPAAVKLASLPLAEVVNHPTFVAAFTARIEERMPELDAAFADCEIG